MIYMRAMITGITGQDGAYLAEFLLSKGYEVHGVKRRSSQFNTQRVDHLYFDPKDKETRFFLHHGDLTDSSNLIRLIQEIQPSEIYNLGAQSHVQVSFEQPEYTAMKRKFSDGTIAILLSPMELIEKLCAMVPPPRAHQVLYTGVFSSHSKWRNLVAINPLARKGFNPVTVDKKKVKNHRWAKLLMRIFKIDVGSCPKCGVDMEIRGAIRDGDSIRRYLRHVGINEHPPAIAQARHYQPQLALNSEQQISPENYPDSMPDHH
jgi:hypothetical protein